MITTPALQARDLRVHYGRGRRRKKVLAGVDLTVHAGEIIGLRGPSGCGKSTLLRTIAGLEGNYSGHMEIGGRDITRAAPSER